MAAYYNEFDKQAAQWLRNLIAAGLIAPGDVDDRSITDVTPDDLRGYTQCHFFAGIGVWSYALRRAGWPDDRPVWTGSCPCQPFSSAGESQGFDDERHLWPSFAWLIEQHRPPVVFGEQVAAKAVEPWVDLVHADLEALGYSFGAVPFPSASVGAPHIRDRLYWAGERLADASGLGLQGRLRGRPDTQWQIEHGSLGRLRSAERLADPERIGREMALLAAGDGAAASSIREAGFAGVCVSPGRLANAPGSGWLEERQVRGGITEGDRAKGRPAGPLHGCAGGGLADDDLIGFVEAPGPELRDEEHHAQSRSGALRLADSDSELDDWSGLVGAGGRIEHPDSSAAGGVVYGRRTGQNHGLWDAVDWLFCQDGKWRPVEPGTLPLAHGSPSRVVRLRAFGNAINAEQATVFVETFLEGEEERVGRSDLTYVDDLI